MLKVREIVNLLEREVPPELQEGWDNTGLLIGFKEREVSKILTCLEIDKREMCIRDRHYISKGPWSHQL